MANDLKSRRRIARGMIKDHPNMQYKTAFKMAGTKRSGKGKKMGRHKSSKKKSGRVGAKYKCVHVIKKVGSLSDAKKHKKEAIRILQQRQAWLLVQMRHETNGKVRNGLKKQEAELHREISLLSK